MMKVKESAIATDRYDVPRLVSAAVKAANSNTIHGFERCFDIVRCLKSLNLSVEDIHRHSRAIHGLASLRDHENAKILTGVNELFSSWMKTLYSRGRENSPSSSSTCNDEATPLNPKKPVVKVCSELKKRNGNIELLRLKKNGHERCQPLRSSEIKRFDATRPLQRQIPVTVKVSEKSPSLKSVSRLTQKKPDAVHVLSKLKKTEVERSLTHKTSEIKQNLTKKQSVLPKKLSLPHQAEGIKQKPHVKVSQNPRCCLALEKKNTREMLELFEIAKKSADVANLKGILLAKEETSICVDTLSLLISYSISSTATETRRIMMRLENLTKHKDRKICKSAASLLDHWRQNIRDQQHKTKLNATKVTK